MGPDDPVRILYNILTYLLLVPYGCYWLIRGVTNRTYFENIEQRFGFGYPQLEHCIWIHAVSVGEVLAAVPLIKALARQYPDRPLLVTTVTATGAARVRAVFGTSVFHSYIPFETPTAVNRFFVSVNPKLARAGERALGEDVVASLADVAGPVDIVNLFRAPENIPAHADEVLAMEPRQRAVWMQLGIVENGSAAVLRDAGIGVVQDRCIMVEHRRLLPG